MAPRTTECEDFGTLARPYSDNVAIQLSYPGDDNTYVARAAEVVLTPGNWSLTVFAICALITAAATGFLATSAIRSR